MPALFPPPPRPLPLLSPGEKQKVLGGTYQSQHHFARELFDTFLGAASGLTLTRPRVADQEETRSHLHVRGGVGGGKMAALSRPHPAWLRSPAIRAVFQPPEPRPFAGGLRPPSPCPSPGQISLTQVSTALGCPCRFLLESLLKIRELAEIEAGLDPRERGRLLHKVLARFTAAFKKVLEADKVWDQQRARELLPGGRPPDAGP